jgi:DNA modification methylase
MPAKAFALLDTRVIYCGDNLDQLRKLPDGCVDLIYIDHHSAFDFANSAAALTAHAHESHARATSKQ